MTALEDVGDRRRLYRWVFRYLTDRTILMSLHAGTTNCRYVNIEVPQGEVLRPTLFKIGLIGLADEVPRIVHALICVYESVFGHLE